VRSGNLTSTVVYNPQPRLNVSGRREVMEVKVCPVQRLSYGCKGEIPHSSFTTLLHRFLSLS